MKGRSLSASYHKVAAELFRNLNTPVSLSCFLLLKYGEWDQLSNLETVPHAYLDCPAGIERFRRDRQATAFLRKSQDLPSSVNKKTVAVEKFYACEKKCAETNYLLECMQLGLEGSTPLIQRAQAVLANARKIIARVLGPLPARLNGRFGPGTCFELEGSPSKTVADKLHITPHVTQAALPVWEHTTDGLHFARRRLALGLPHVAYARGNRFTTTAKDARTDRGICVEPQGNLYCQLGVGDHMKRRLSRVGLFVNRDNTPLGPIQLLTSRPAPNGQLIHRAIAKLASRDGSWATIDLSDASDTVCYQLVRMLLPPDWFALLDSIRSPFTRINKIWHKLDKFSSMGNGFTFELETLIFAALSCGEGDELGVDVFAYGDDILIRRERARDVMAILSFFGFTPNPRKSFHTGLFRESCGGDYFGGEDVRPVFSKREPREPVEWFALHNQITKKWPSFKTVRSVIREQVPSCFRVFGPSRVGDTVFHTRKTSLWSDYTVDRRVAHRDRVKARSFTGCNWITGLVREPLKLPLERWGSEFVVSLALLGVASDGIEPRGAAPYGWRLHPLSIS